MGNEDKIILNGKITESLRNAMFRILVDGDKEIIGYLSGKMRMNKINILIGDKVTVEVSRYDLTKGRITYRAK